MKEKDNRDGPGRNQGRKLKYGEPTVKVNYRIPASKKYWLDAYVAAKLKRWSKGSS